VTRTDSAWPFVQLAVTRGLMQSNGNTFGAGDTLTRRQAAQLIAKRFNFPTGNLPETATFADVPINDPDRPAIEALFRAGITAGCGASPRTFCPNDPIPRWQFAVFLSRGLNLNTALAQSEPAFSDVAKTDTSFPYVQLLYQTGLTIGCQTNPSKFCPNDILQKSQAAIFLARSLTNTSKIAPYQQAGGQPVLPPSENLKAPNLWLDTPGENTNVYRSAVLQGWAIDNVSNAESAISKVEIYLDGNKVGDATYGTNRADVCAAYPNRKNCPNVGFTYNLNVATLSDGPHLIKVVATDSDPSPKTAEVTRKITVNNSTSSCKKGDFRPQTSGFSANASGPIQARLSVSPGQTFYVFADFGFIADSIWFNNSSGIQCAWAGSLNQPPSSPGWLSTAAVFSCTAPSAPGDYNFEAGTHAGTASNTCETPGPIGSITVSR